MVCQHRRNVPQPPLPPPPPTLYLLVIPGTNRTILIFCLILQNSAKQKQQGLEVKNILSDLKSPMFITIVIGLGLVFLVFLTGLSGISIADLDARTRPKIQAMLVKLENVWVSEISS